MDTIKNSLLMNLAHSINWFFRNHPIRGAYRLTKLISKCLLPHHDNVNTPVAVKTLYGFNFWIEHLSSEGIEKEIFYRGTYEAGTLNVMQKCLNKGDCFFDVGTNVGLMTIFAAIQVSEKGVVHAFEPELRALSVANKNIEINSLQNIRLNNIALGSAKGILTLYSHDEISLGSATLVKESSKKAGTEVKVNTLDNYIKENKIQTIRMMKIDVEGWEYEVVKGCEHLLKSAEAPILCLEYCQDSHHLNDLEELYHFLCTINDYQIFKLAKTKEWVSNLVRIKNFNELPKHDNIFCFLPKHLKTLPENLFL